MGIFGPGGADHDVVLSKKWSRRGAGSGNALGSRSMQMAFVWHIGDSAKRGHIAVTGIHFEQPSPEPIDSCPPPKVGSKRGVACQVVLPMGVEAESARKLSASAGRAIKPVPDLNSGAVVCFFWEGVLQNQQEGTVFALRLGGLGNGTRKMDDV